MTKELLDKSIAVVELEIPKEGGPFVVISKKHLLELRAALRAIMSGEKALRGRKTRGFREFVSKEFPAHAKNL